MSKKRTLENFFSPVSEKKPRLSDDAPKNHTHVSTTPASNHATYPFPISDFPSHISDQLTKSPAVKGTVINNQPDLDLLYFQPYVPKSIERDLFEFLRRELFFYRVQYNIKRGPTETTTVFGVDSSALFRPDGSLVDAQSGKPIAPLSSRYRTCRPRPIPACLDRLRQTTEAATGTSYNFCLVNYYANGNDSISYHSDDERFLGPDPCIASFSLGAKRDFLLKHKPLPPPPAASSSEPTQKSSPQKNKTPPSPSKLQPQPGSASTDKPLKFALASGDMMLMRGRTQSHWLHSIPKRAVPSSKSGPRSNTAADPGRINITFRKAMTKAGTENYYCYNVGSGKVWKWDEGRVDMLVVEQGDGERG
ncbi:hypothetical protein MMC07_008497 [Pseudocyphellaria aurata]|nr:hypothetical protein [Pseudocyphellaria aurata]